MLRALKYIHSAGIIHRDLKPSNILLNENCDLKICDFGLAREQDAQMTGYVTTRYYRAPEIMLTWQKYTYAVDIWSVGCILAEMLLGRILFPGKDHIHQFTLITELLGKPPREVMDKVYSNTTLKFVEALPDRERRPLSSVFKDADPQAVDLVEKMLNLDPEERISVSDALKHSYLSTYHDSQDEPVFDGQLDWSLLEAEHTAEEWKTHMYFEVLNYHKGFCDGDIKESRENNGGVENWLKNEMMQESY